MAYGVPPKVTRTYPTGSRGFSETAQPKGEVTRPGTFIEGQHREGTPAGRESTRASSSRYEDKESQKVRADYRGESQGLTGRRESEGPNPRVHSKAVRRYGVDGSRLDARYKSTGEQNPHQQHDEVPPSLPQRTYTDRLPPGGIVRQVGFPGGGKPFVEVDHSRTMRRHGSDGLHDMSKSTDRAPGQARSASGSRFGEPQKRPPQRTVTAEKPGDSGALNRREYIGSK